MLSDSTFAGRYLSHPQHLRTVGVLYHTSHNCCPVYCTEQNELDGLCVCLCLRLERDHENALQRQKDAITKTLNSEMLRAMKEKDAEMRRQLAEAREREELLKLQVREAVRAGRDVAGCQQTGACSGAIQKLQQEATALRSQNKQLEERLQVNVLCDCVNGWDCGEVAFPLLVYLTEAPITVHCTSSQVNTCHAVPTNGESDKCTNIM